MSAIKVNLNENFILVHFPNEKTSTIIDDSKKKLQRQTQAYVMDDLTRKWVLGDIIFRGLQEFIKLFSLNIVLLFLI